ncbi:unnamed protein product [Linum trigynum]|uniref:Uncharacterized protein n=1 Tax=Linum trigynum TaxID=586398 RepID=A0AAV2FYR4_9ROSI
MGALIHTAKDGDWSRLAVVSKLRQLMTEIEDEFDVEEEALDNLVLGFQVHRFAGYQTIGVIGKIDQAASDQKALAVVQPLLAESESLKSILTGAP